MFTWNPKPTLKRIQLRTVITCKNMEADASQSHAGKKMILIQQNLN